MNALSKTITDNIRYRTISSDRDKAATQARSAQARFRKMTRTVVLTTLGAAIFGGLLLYSVDLETAPQNPHLLHYLDESPWQPILIVLQALCLAGAAFAGYRLTSEDLKGTWRRSRMTAEDLRLERERAALELAHEEGAGTFKTAGALFLNFIEEQRDYLASRESTANMRRGSLALVGALAAGLTAGCSVLLGVESALVLAFVGLVGVLAPAATAAVQSWSEATAENERAALHRQTADELGRLLQNGDSFSKAVAENDLPLAMGFAEKVFAALRRDHSGFAAVLKTKDGDE